MVVVITQSGLSNAHRSAGVAAADAGDGDCPGAAGLVWCDGWKRC